MTTEPSPPQDTPLTPPEDMRKKNARLALIIAGVVVGMIGLSFASVPLYSLFCRVTGFGGTPQTADALPDEILERVVTVQFNAETDRRLPWSFKPEERSIDVKLGQKGLTAYRASNTSDTPVTGTAVYNVTPPKAGQYFHKIACFCFGEQTLEAGQETSMPVMFFIDPAMNDDPNMNDVKTITLSYTFYRAESKELEQAMDGFYNQ